MPPRKKTPQEARELIDSGFVRAGWIFQDRDELNLQAGRGVAICEFRMKPGHGFADYLLFVDGRAVGALEAKPAGHPLVGVEAQGDKCAAGLPDTLDAPLRPLPFVYLSNGDETRFTNLLDPEPRSRPLFNVHQPETLAGHLKGDAIEAWVRAGSEPHAAMGAPAYQLRGHSPH